MVLRTRNGDGNKQRIKRNGCAGSAAATDQKRTVPIPIRIARVLAETVVWPLREFMSGSLIRSTLRHCESPSLVGFGGSWKWRHSLQLADKSLQSHRRQEHARTWQIYLDNSTYV